jgi:hypothetical protein
MALLTGWQSTTSRSGIHDLLELLTWGAERHHTASSPFPGDAEECAPLIRRQHKSMLQPTPGHSASGSVERTTCIPADWKRRKAASAWSV